MKQYSLKTALLHVLNGAAVGIVATLIPGAIFGELFKALSGTFPFLSTITPLFTMSNSLIGLAIGIGVSYLFKLSVIESISVGVAVFLSGGAVQVVDSTMVMSGTGDIITMTFTAALAVALVSLIRPYVKGYAVLAVPSVSVIVSATVGCLLRPYCVTITTLIGQGVSQLLILEQTVMCILLAIIFAFLIVSPISSVGIALAISLSGVGSGAANLGVCASMFALAVAGRRVNSLGVCLAHVIGSPKISMPVILTHPITFVPIAVNAAVLGICASLFSVQGTALSAGFGVSGLVGPLAHLNAVGFSFGTVVSAVGLFGVLPLALGYATDYLFVHRLKWIRPEYYTITI